VDVYFEQFLENYGTNANFWASIFDGSSYVLNLTMNGMGYFLGDFISSSSCHPGAGKVETITGRVFADEARRFQRGDDSGSKHNQRRRDVTTTLQRCSDRDALVGKHFKVYFFKYKMLPPHTVEGFDLTPHSSNLLDGRRRRYHYTTPRARVIF
jgi:hypothetical protein